MSDIIKEQGRLFHVKKMLLAILMTFGLFGCNNKEKNIKVKIDTENMPTKEVSSTYLYDNYSLLSYHLNNTEEFDEKIQDKDSFFVFIFSDVCSGCKLLAPALKPSVDEGVTLYTLEYSKISDKHILYQKGVTTTPYLVLVDKGDIVYVELINLSFTDSNGNIEKVNKWVKKHIEWGNN